MFRTKQTRSRRGSGTARRAAVAAACSAVMAGASIAAAGPASADSSLTWYGLFPNRLAHASFKSYGEVLSVSDDERDGLAVRAYWGYSGSSVVQARCTNTNGAGTTKTCNYSIAEGRGIWWCLERVDFDGSEGHGAGAVWTFKCKSDHA